MKIADVRGWKVFRIVLPVLLAVCSYSVFRVATVHHIVRAASPVTPFTFQARIYLHNTDQLHSTLTVARRSDGTMVQIRSIGPLAKGLTVRTIKYMDAGMVSFVDVMRSRQTWPPRNEKDTSFQRMRVLNPPSNCVFGKGDTLLKEHSVVLGQMVAVILHNAVEGLRIREWRARDLGCTALQSQVEQRQTDGSYRLMSQMKPVSLQLVAPDPRLFASARDYTELGPSEMSMDIRERLGYSIPGQAEEFAARLDAEYESALAAHPDWVAAH